MSLISVTELNLAIKKSLDGSEFRVLEVVGEVSGYKISGPHAYFTVKDEQSAISCASFYCAKKYQPKDGEQVIIKGGLNFWTKRGSVNLVADEIQPYGNGLLALKFEELKKKLEAEGLFNPEHKKPIKKFNKNVLILTSKTGAVIRDIKTTIRNKNPYMDIVVKDVRVQGDGAGEQIAKALKNCDKLGYDVIVIARGGGSLEDLTPFYDETLARAVYDAVTPVVSAVGHETDFSLIDFVADRRAATPTAAAELVAFDYYELLSNISALMEYSLRAVSRKFSNKLRAFELCQAKFSRSGETFYASKQAKLVASFTKLSQNVRRVLNQKIIKVKELNLKMLALLSASVQSAEERSGRAFAKLDGLSPLKVLSRGYFKVSVDGTELSSVKPIKKGDSVKAVGSDGSFEAQVTKVDLRKE